MAYRDPLSELRKVVGEWEGASSLLGPHREFGPNRVKKSKSNIPIRTSPEEYFRKSLSPGFKEELEWAPRRDWKKTGLPQRPSGTSAVRLEGEVSLPISPEIQKANIENLRRRRPAPPVSPISRAYQAPSVAEPVITTSQLGGLKGEINRQFRQNKGFVRSLPTKAVGEVVENIPRASDSAKVAATLDDLIDFKAAKSSIGLYGAYGLMGLDLLSAREKTGPVAGLAGAITAGVVLRNANPFVRLGGAAAAYMIGRTALGFAIGSIDSQHEPEIEGLYEGGVAAARRQKYTEFGSGWLSKAWGGIRSIFGGKGPKVRPDIHLSSFANRLLTGQQFRPGGALGQGVGADLRRMNATQMISNMEKSLATEGISVVRGQKQWKAHMVDNLGYTEEEAVGFLQKHRRGEAAYIPEQEAIFLGSSGSVLKSRYGTSSRADLLFSGRFKEAFSSTKDIEAFNLAHEAREAYIQKNYLGKNQRAGINLSTHEEGRIYTDEASIGALLGKNTASYHVNLRKKEAIGLLEENVTKIEEGLLQRADWPGPLGRMNRAIDPDAQVKMSFVRRMMTDIEDVYKGQGLLNRESQNTIEKVKRTQTQILQKHRETVEAIAGKMRPDNAAIVQRYARSKTNLRRSNRISSMAAQHEPTISGLHENGLAASERHLSTDFGSGWLSRVSEFVGKLTGRGIRRQAAMSSALREVLHTGGATGRDFARKRLGGKRGIEITTKYLKEKDIDVVFGEEELFKSLVSKGVSDESQARGLAKTYLEKRGPAGFIPKHKIVYMTNKDNEILKLATEGKSRWQLLKEGKFRLAMASPEKLTQEVKATVLGHEALEVEYRARRVQSFSTKTWSHETLRIYRSEAEFNTMLGRNVSEMALQDRLQELPNVILISGGKVRDAIANQSSDMILRTIEPRNAKLNRVVGNVGYWEFKEELNRFSRVRTATDELKNVFRREKMLSKRTLGRIEETESIMKNRLRDYAHAVEVRSDQMMKVNPHEASLLRRHAERTKNLKESKVRTLSKQQIAERFTQEAGILTKKKQLGKLNREVQVQRAANTRGSISRASQGRDVPGMPETGEAARLNRRLGYHSGIDPFRKFLAKIGKNFNEVRESVHFQRALREGTALETIGAGGMGSVKKMEATIPPEALGLSQEHVGSIPKLKYLRKEYTTEYGKDFSVSSMQAEEKGLKAIEDTLGPSVYGTVSVDDSPFMFMEHLEQTTTLKEYLKKGEKFTDKQFTAIEDGLNLMHQRGIAHGDLSAKNILINKQGQPFIIDPAPSRLAPGGNLSAIDPHARELTLAQDTVGLEVLENAVNRQFTVAQEAIDASDKMWFASNVNSLHTIDPDNWLSNLPGAFAGKREEAFSIFQKIRTRVRKTNPDNIFGIRDSIDDQMALATTTGHGQVPKNVAVAVNQSDTVATAIDGGMRPKVHFNQRNQELMRHSVVTQGNTAAAAPGRRHRNMQAAQDNMLKQLDGVNLFKSIGEDDITM